MKRTCFPKVANLCEKNSWMKKLAFIIVATLVSVSGFAQIKKFKVEIPLQPKFKISDSIQSFTILNRSLAPEFQNYREDSLQVSFYRKNFVVDSILLDSIAADTTIKALGDLLFDSERFDIVIPVDRNIKRDVHYNKTPAPLDWDFVEEACRTYNTDALIVLENIAMRTVTNYKTRVEYLDYSSQKAHYASMDLYYRAHWRIYYPKEKSILVDFIMSEDTIFWDSYEYDLLETFKKLPTVKQACIETGIKVALDFSEIITPGWKEAVRYYYLLDNASIDQSVEMAANGDWEHALQNWLNYVSVGKNSQQSKVMLNVALGYEMTGELDKAIEWVKRSNDLYYREVANFYLKELLLRKSTMNGKTDQKKTN